MRTPDHRGRKHLPGCPATGDFSPAWRCEGDGIRAGRMVHRCLDCGWVSAAPPGLRPGKVSDAEVVARIAAASGLVGAA